MKTASTTPKYGRKPILFAVALAGAALLAAPVFTSPGKQSSEDPELFKPYRASVELKQPVPQILAEARLQASSNPLR